MPDTASERLISIYRDLARSMATLQFAAPVTHVYNPLDYAREPAEAYLRLAARPGGQVLLLGMNPGPWGMAQTGVPFGSVEMATRWLGIGGRVDRPQDEHPKRPVLGFDNPREEVSGTRVWGWAEEKFGSRGRFFDRFFVANYCPLVFMEASGRNRTPDKLPAAERQPLFKACDEALQSVVRSVKPSQIVGIGKFAEDRARAALPDAEIPIGRVLHPSPASPIANRGWAPQAERQLAALGIELG